MENETVQNETLAQETVNYGNQATEQVEGIIKNVDFGIFMTMLVAVVSATIGISVGMSALKKGVSWVKRAIKRAGQ